MMPVRKTASDAIALMIVNEIYENPIHRSFNCPI
jgi:hypothetical protein